MFSLRYVALRVSSATGTASSSRLIRTAELQLRQGAVQRRTYASAHGGHGEAKSSDVPWMAAAAAGTISGLYFVFSQDLGHGSTPDEGDHAEAHDTHGKTDGEDDAQAESKDNSKEDPKDEQTGKMNEKNSEKKIEKREDPSQPGAGRPDRTEEARTVGHGPKESPKASEPGKAAPDKSDKPDPRGKPKSFNETSGKQEGMSNADTHHSSQISQQSDKSKKGEGVAESAKLKGTVSTNRPGAENKEERGKAQMDKDA